MERRLIVRGVLSGALGGFFAFWFTRVLAEPEIDRAIAYEGARDAAQRMLQLPAGAPVPAEEQTGEVLSRSVQASLGLGVGLIGFGAAIGALLAVAYCLYHGRVGRLRPRTLALLIAGGGFVVVYLVPFLKYPASPPAVGHGETIGPRSGLSLMMVAFALLLGIGAVWLGQLLAPRWGNWYAAIGAGVAFVISIGVVIALMPSLGELHANRQSYGGFGTETPQPLTAPDGEIVFPAFPADVLYRFRLYSVGAQLLLWTTLGLVFGALAERLLPSARADRRQAAPGESVV